MHLDRSRQFNKYGVSLYSQKLDVVNPIPAHTHDFSELVIIVNGTAEHMIENDSYRASKGDIYILLGDIAHCFKNTDTLTVVNIMFDLADLGISVEKLKALGGFRALFNLEPRVRKIHKFKSRLKLGYSQLEYLTNLHDDMHNELERGNNYVAISILIHIITHLSNCYEKVTDRQHRSLINISRVLNYIEQNYQTHISLKVLSEISYMSESTLLRKFHEALNVNPIQYLQKYRIEKACQLLTNTDMLVTEVAFEVGFNSLNYFCRYFKKMVGLSPRSFRKIDSCVMS